MKRNLKLIKALLPLILIITIFTGCSSTQMYTTPEQSSQSTIDVNTSKPSSVAVSPSNTTNATNTSDTANTVTMDGKYKLIEVDGGDRRGDRESMVVVDVGFGDREYWAYTNKYGQLVRVTAKRIILQDDNNEPVTADGRYYEDEASVPGTERKDMDQGHVIADSLGGVSNAYNITPQDSVMNRSGDQAYMEKVIRDAGGCTNFEAVITYSDTKTQIPNHYHYTYTIKGNLITEDFDNINPDEVNKSLNSESTPTSETTNEPSSTSENHDISSIDTNNNGKISIAEAKAAGYKMPITKDNWLYQYMTDGDGDGAVGE